MSNPLTEYCEQWQREARATMGETLEQQRARLEAQQARMQADAERVNAILAERVASRRVGVDGTPAVVASAPAPAPKPLTPLEQLALRNKRLHAWRQYVAAHPNSRKSDGTLVARDPNTPPEWFRTGMV
jgi:hypothetical protein